MKSQEHIGVPKSVLVHFILYDGMSQKQILEAPIRKEHNNGVLPFYSSALAACICSLKLLFCA